ALPGPAQSLIASFVIGVPMFVAAGTAWKFLSEVVIAGGATFRGLSGILGGATKAVQAFMGAEELATGVEATHAKTLIAEGEAAAAAEKGFSGLTRGVLSYAGALVSAIEIGRGIGEII